MHRKQKHTAKKRTLYRMVGVVVMVAVIAGLLSQVVFAQNSYIIKDGGNVTVHKSYSTDPDEVLTEAGIELNEEDTYTTQVADGVSEITIRRMQMVTVVYQGTQNVIGTYGETAGQLLARMGISLAEGDVLSCDESTMTSDGMRIEIIHKQTEIVEYEEVVPYEVNRYEDPTLEPDAEIVLIEGRDGLIRYRTQITYENGIETERTVLQETEVTKAISELVVCGVDRIIMEQPEEPVETVKTSGSSSGTSSGSSSGSSANSGTPTASGGTLTTSGGQTYTYTKVLSVTATAYSCEGYTGTTATGTVARVGAIAVDPKVIPYGTKMYVVSNDGKYIYGYCTAEDCGNFRGNHIDLYFETVDECWQFGRRNCTVYILA